MALLKLIVITLFFKFFCSIGVLEPVCSKNVVQPSINLEQAMQQDSLDQHKKMGASKHTPISIIVE